MGKIFIAPDFQPTIPDSHDGTVICSFPCPFFAIDPALLLRCGTQELYNHLLKEGKQGEMKGREGKREAGIKQKMGVGQVIYFTEEKYGS